MKRSWVIGAVAAAGAAETVRRLRRRQDERTKRTLAVAGLGTRVGTRYAAHKARTVFADAARKDELDQRFQLRTAQDVTEALGHMKGALMKLGQMASFLDDGLPEPMRDALATLQQDAPPMSAELAAQVIEEELGAPPYEVFSEWDPVPIAAASIGQVHRAMTRHGDAVAVKVQYPGIGAAIGADLDNTEFLVTLTGMAFPSFDQKALADELRARITEELDYRREAANQRLFADYYRDHPFIHVPRVIDGLSTDRVLTTELATGARFKEVVTTWTEHERNLAAEAIYRFVFRSIYRMHAFNGDPHPGNYLFRPGGRVTFLDFGLVKRFDRTEVTMFENMARTIAIDHDGDSFRHILEQSDILKPGSGMSDGEVFDYFGHFYLPVLEDLPFAFTHTYARETVQRLIASDRKVARYGNVPPHSVIIQRINLGLYSILAELGATANWRRVAEELWPFTDGPPSTPLGEEEYRWLARAGEGTAVR